MITLPNSYHTDVLNDEQILVLAKFLPCPKAQTGRPSYSNNELLPGILKVLRSGMRWRDLDNRLLPSNITHWRRLRLWESRLGLKKIFDLVLSLLDKKGQLNLKIASIDGSLIPSFNFLDTTGYSGKHHLTGTKISNLVDFLGTPLNVVFDSGNTHDIKLSIPTITNNSVGKLGTILADKGYDSDHFRLILAKFGIATNIPQRDFKNRIKDPNYSIPLGKMRFKIERTQAWMKSFRRIHFRFDYTLASFKAFTYLALIVICIRKLI